MDGERSASENLAKRAFFRIRQNPASPKPRVWKYLILEPVQYRVLDRVRVHYRTSTRAPG